MTRSVLIARVSAEKSSPVRRVARERERCELSGEKVHNIDKGSDASRETTRYRQLFEEEVCVSTEIEGTRTGKMGTDRR